MKITDLKAYVVTPPPLGKFHASFRPRPANFFFLRIETDEGITGESCIWTGDPWLYEGKILNMYKDLLIGKDPLNREAFWQYGWGMTAQTHDMRAISAVDIALWDIAGKAANMPVYKLLGAYRDRMPAYASTLGYSNIEEYVDLCKKLIEEGYTAIKLHSFAVCDKDIELCTAVRKAVGPDIKLMIDPLNVYDRFEALKLGLVLRDLDFFWFEAPIPDSDVDGLAWLRQNLPGLRIVVGESNMVGFPDFPKYIYNKAADVLRGVGDATGGITAMRKAAGLCEAFGLGYEPHSYGPTLVQAAHLHFMLSIKNSCFFEAPVPTGICDTCMIDTIKVQPDGYVYPSNKPGLGYEVDWEQVKERDSFNQIYKG